MTILQFLSRLFTGKSIFLVSYNFTDEEGTTPSDLVIHCPDIMFPVKAIQEYADELYPTMEGEVTINWFTRLTPKEARLFGADAIKIGKTRR